MAKKLRTSCSTLVYQRMRWLSAALDEVTRLAFERSGAFVASHPWKVSRLDVVLIGCCGSASRQQRSGVVSLLHVCAGVVYSRAPALVCASGVDCSLCALVYRCVTSCGVLHAASPLQVIFACVLLAGLLTIGVVNLETGEAAQRWWLCCCCVCHKSAPSLLPARCAESSPEKLWTPRHSTATKDQKFVTAYFPDFTTAFAVYATAQRSRPDANLLALPNVKDAVLDTIRLHDTLVSVVARCEPVGAAFKLYPRCYTVLYCTLQFLHDVLSACRAHCRAIRVRASPCLTRACASRAAAVRHARSPASATSSATTRRWCSR